MPHGLGLHTPSSEKASRASLCSCTSKHCKAVGFALLRLSAHSDTCWSSGGSPGAGHNGPEGRWRWEQKPKERQRRPGILLFRNALLLLQLTHKFS